MVKGEEKIRLWHGSNESRQEICLPESVHNLVGHSMFIEIPHIIFNVGAGDIKVLKMAATQLHLVKSIPIPGYSAPRPIDNKFCLGFLQSTNGNHIVHVFQKRELFSPDETEGRRIEVDGKPYGGPVNINTTSLLWQRRETEGGVPVWMGLVKKDFWI